MKKQKVIMDKNHVKSIISSVVVIAGILLIWRFGFYPVVPEKQKPELGSVEVNPGKTEEGYAIKEKGNGVFLITSKSGVSHKNPSFNRPSWEDCDESLIDGFLELKDNYEINAFSFSGSDILVLTRGKKHQ